MRPNVFLNTVFLAYFEKGTNKKKFLVFLFVCTFQDLPSEEEKLKEENGWTTDKPKFFYQRKDCKCLLVLIITLALLFIFIMAKDAKAEPPLSSIPELVMRFFLFFSPKKQTFEISSF
jgi:hypothetical protein